MIIIIIITLRSTFYCTIAKYVCHNFFKLNQTFILTGCREDLWVSECCRPNPFVHVWRHAEQADFRFKEQYNINIGPTRYTALFLI